MRPYAPVLCAFVALAACGTAVAGTTNITMSNVTNNTTIDLAPQLIVQLTGITEGGNDRAVFEFRNNVGTASSICQIYFDDRTNNLGLVRLEQSTGVKFKTTGIAPPDMPGGNTLLPTFEATTSLSSGVNGPTANGINASGEYLRIVMSLGTGTLGSLIAALESGDVRIGMHIRAIGPTGGSDSYVSVGDPGTVVIIPLPAAGSLGLAGILGIAARRQRRGV